VTALDMSTQAQIVNLLGDLQRELGVAYLFISHDLTIGRQLSDDIAVMYLGRIVEMAGADAIHDAPKHPYTEALLSAIPIADPRHQRARERIVLKGDIPSPANPPPGCHFHTRCPFVMDICRVVDPPAFTCDDGAITFCHLHTEGPRLAGEPVTTLRSTPARSAVTSET
jgi:oligopeptide/dipeptide ABC transporter ATP-binding protein